MQTTDAGTLLNILNSPIGGALLPTMAAREGMVMDQSRATLADTLARTGIAQDENRRANEMQPGRLQGQSLENIGKDLSNQDAKFKGSVRDTLGVDHYVQEAQNKLTADDLRIAEAGVKNFSTIAGVISGAPDAPGARRAMAIEMIGKYKLPTSMIDTINKMEESQIGPAFEKMAENAARLSRQNFMQDRKLENNLDMQGLKNLGAADVARINAQARVDAARIVAAAKRAAGGDTKAEKLNMEQYYVRARQNEQNAQNPEQKAYWAAVAEQVYKDIQNKPAAAGAVGTTLIPQGPGKSPVLGPAPKVQPQPTAPLPERPAGVPLPASQNPTAPTVANAQTRAAAQSTGTTRYKFNPATGKIELQ